MKNIKITFALLIIVTLSTTLFSCESDVTIDNPGSETIQKTDDILINTSAETGNQGDVEDTGRE